MSGTRRMPEREILAEKDADAAMARSARRRARAEDSSSVAVPEVPVRPDGGNLALQRALGVGELRHDLEMSKAGDADEREAERVAAQAEYVAGPLHCDRARAAERPSVGSAPALGSLLDTDVQATMRGQLGHDFSSVRVHTDSRASESAREFHARAFTVGESIVFGAGEYSPTTCAGRRLLVHELAHVVQQRKPGAAYRTKVHRFESPEHVQLGDASAGPATGLILLRCHDRDFPERTRPQSEWTQRWRDLYAGYDAEQRRALTRGLTYGEVVALSGDMYADFNALNEAPLTEVIRLVPLIRSHTTTTEQFQAATGGRYLALAKRNESHFSNVPVGRRNIDVWRETHRQAIAAAREGNANLAWGLNASADHFLTDAFSGGHIRTPRSQLMGSDLGNVESKILHDLDNTYGVEVTNARGDPAWVAYGDNFLDDPRNAISRTKALEAVQLSKQDIADALSQRTSYPDPRTTAGFAAEALVPRPVDPNSDRWSGRTPTYSTTPEGPVREADDYTMMRDRVIRSEGPGVVRSFFTDDDEIRAWVSTTDPSALARQRVGEKIRMLNTLSDGWISEDDMLAMERILRSVASLPEMQLIRAAMQPRERDFSDLGQRTRFRVALSRNP